MITERHVAKNWVAGLHNFNKIEFAHPTISDDITIDLPKDVIDIEFNAHRGMIKFKGGSYYGIRMKKKFLSVIHFNYRNCFIKEILNLSVENDY